MAKIIELTYDGKFIHWQYYCLGCKHVHAFGLEHHQFNRDLEKPTITPSLLENRIPGKICHSFIRDGKIQYLDDCWHELAGQTIELPEFPDEFKPIT